jgi:hypothetical protein
MFLRWRQMQEEDRSRVWLLYGWFSGLMFLGSVFGAVTWGAWMQFLVALFKSSSSSVPPAQYASLNAQGQYWACVFFVTYAIEFMCLSVAKLLVLDRMADFLNLAKGDGMRRRLAVGGRVVMAAVVVGNVVGLCGNIAAAAFAKESGDLYTAATSAFAANATDVANHAVFQAKQKLVPIDDASAAQQYCEVAVLLIVILEFAVVGGACARRLSSALHNMNDWAAGRQLRRQILGTVSFVLVTFLLRAVFSTMNAVSDVLQAAVGDCAAVDASVCDPQCYNVWYLMQFWLDYTPEFQLMVELISTPLALLVALWGMTSERMLQLMKSGRGQGAATDEHSVQLRVK